MVADITGKELIHVTHVEVVTQDGPATFLLPGSYIELEGMTKRVLYVPGQYDPYKSPIRRRRRVNTPVTQSDTAENDYGGPCEFIFDDPSEGIEREVALLPIIYHDSEKNERLGMCLILEQIAGEESYRRLGLAVIDFEEVDATPMYESDMYHAASTPEVTDCLTQLKRAGFEPQKIRIY